MNSVGFEIGPENRPEFDDTVLRRSADTLMNRSIEETERESALSDLLQSAKDLSGRSATSGQLSEAYSWLADFASDWSQYSSAESSHITQIVGVVEAQATRLQLGAYTRSDRVSAVAEHITDRELRYGFALRHVMDTETENPFQIRTPKDGALVGWLSRTHDAKQIRIPWVGLTSVSDEEVAAVAAFEQRIDTLCSESLAAKAGKLLSRAV